MFIQNLGPILPRNLICEKIWEAQCEVGANLLDVYMSRLRPTAMESIRIAFPYQAFAYHYRET
jgi:DNA-binding response OmpR family regulator